MLAEGYIVHNLQIQIEIPRKLFLKVNTAGDSH